LREDLRKLGAFEKSPPGTLGGLLLNGKAPFSGAEACLWRKGRATGPEIPGGREPLKTTLIAANGTFSFSHLKAEWYFVGIRIPGEQARVASDWLKPVGETKRAVIVLGTASVFGNITDQNRPFANVAVRLEIKGHRGVSTTIVETRTDRDGRYEFTRLLGSHARVSVPFGGLDRGFSLKQGERRREDFSLDKK